MILASFASRTTSFGTRRDALGKKKLVRLVMLGKSLGLYGLRAQQHSLWRNGRLALTLGRRG